MTPEEIADTTLMHRKVFDDPGMSGDGMCVHLYYKYSKNFNVILVENFTIHFIINGNIGDDISENRDEVDDELYNYMFKQTYYEIVNTVIPEN